MGVESKLRRTRTVEVKEREVQIKVVEGREPGDLRKQTIIFSNLYMKNNKQTEEGDL